LRREEGSPKGNRVGARRRTVPKGYDCKEESWSKGDGGDEWEKKGAEKNCKRKTGEIIVIELEGERGFQKKKSVFSGKRAATTEKMVNGWAEAGGSSGGVNADKRTKKKTGGRGQRTLRRKQGTSARPKEETKKM